MTVLTREDGLTALGEAEQASRLWGSDAAEPPWRASLARLVALSGAVLIGLDLVSTKGGWYTAPPADRWVLPLYDGDPPDDPVGARLARRYQRDELAEALQRRAWARAKRRSVEAIRATHRAVHQALAGETDGATIPGCPHCRG